MHLHDGLICPAAADTARALGLLDDYCTKLRRPEEQQLKTAIQRVVGIFQSNLFEALLGEFLQHSRWSKSACLLPTALAKLGKVLDQSLKAAKVNSIPRVPQFKTEPTCAFCLPFACITLDGPNIR